MFNEPIWSTILKESYGLESELMQNVFLFRTHRGLEMNIVGDYIDLAETKSSETDNLPIRYLTNVAYDSSSALQQTGSLLTYRLDTTSPFEEILKQKIHKKTRNLILKAEKNEVQTKRSTHFNDLKKYYRLYVKNSLRIGAFPHSFHLWRSMWIHLGPEKMLLFLSRKDGELLSGILALKDEKRGRLHIWASAQNVRGEALAANTGTYAFVLRYASSAPDITQVDFGNSEPNSSLAFFKSRFGGTPIPVHVSEKLQGKSSPRRPVLLRSLSVLPAGVFSVLSQFVYRTIR